MTFPKMHTRGNFGKFVKIAYVLYVYFYIVSLFSGYFRNFLLHESCKKLPLSFIRFLSGSKY